MKRALYCSALLLIALCGCSKGSIPPPDADHSELEGNSREERESNIPAEPPNTGWMLDSEISGIDGDTYTARRSYNFPKQRTSFDVSISCSTSSRETRFTVDSIVGDPAAPSERSGYIIHDSLIGSDPDGKAKSTDDRVTDLNQFFSVGQDYRNRLIFNFHNPVADDLVAKDPMSFRMTVPLNNRELNYAKVAVASLPITLQIKNGAGPFEIHIDRSAEVQSALLPCGANDSLLTEEYFARAQEKVQKQQKYATSTVESICLKYGAINDTTLLSALRTEQGVQDFKLQASEVGVDLECVSSAPDPATDFEEDASQVVESTEDSNTP